jgi:hypothetical protein
MVLFGRGLEQMIWVEVIFLNTKMRQSSAIMRQEPKLDSESIERMDNTWSN